MRLHELEIAAFGPFTDPVTVDLDDLAGQGLFLLSGPTGAGKTSVLDAICFALYGEVPGDRASAKRLRSDQAAPHAEPRVRLVLTVAGRRFEVTRSPAWQRPKKRGTGTTPQQATVRVRERLGGPGGAWTTHTTRHDEAGLLVGGLLGMNQSQFTQVAMLPQGRFQAFLRADADERQQLLQQLFGTARFERVEAWLRERRTALRRVEEAAHRQLAEAVNRTSEAADEPLPGWDCDDLGAPAAAGDLDTWAGGLAGDASTAHRALAGVTDDVETEELDARRAVERARALAARRRRLEQARDDLARLEGRADAHARASADLDAARRAAGIPRVHALAEAASSACLRATTARESSAMRAAGLLGLDLVEAEQLTGGGWAALAEAERRAATDAETRLPSARRLLVVRGDGARLRAEVPAARRHRDEVARRVAEAPARVAALREAYDEAREAAARAESLRGEATVITARLAAWARADDLTGALGVAREAHREAQDQTLACRVAVLDLREARLAGMAGEIAHDLAVGDSCPVCGSHEHPAKAAPSPSSPRKGAEGEARRAVDSASAAEFARAEVVRNLETELSAARARATDDDDLNAVDLAQRQARTEVALSTAQDLASLAPARATALDHAEREQRAGVEATTEAVTRLAGLEARLEAAVVEQRDLEDALADLAPEGGACAGDPAGLVTLLRRRVADHACAADAATSAARAVEALDRATAHHVDVSGQLDDALVDAGFVDAGFVDLGAALGAVLGDRDLRALAVQVRHHDERLAAVRAVLDDHAHDRASDPTHDPDDEQPDPAAREREHAAALVALRSHHARLDDLARRTARLGELAVRVQEAVAAWAPVHHELEVVTRLSSFVDGKSGDNRWSMRLSAYVLAFRLSQVVAAANVRLGRMSDQRYSLEHTADRGRDRRGGLGLLVRDDWSGESRNPATLSGGETFVVSLALALGLSDVVAAEAGGVELSTLFVDEGFGSLDAQTLDDVMDTLDALREGGRVVGVVSHVAEMRERIPTQLIVNKQRSGSTLTIRR